MTTQDVAKALGCDVQTVVNNAKKVLPAKAFAQGKQTFWAESEVTVLLAYMKQPKSSGALINFQAEIGSTETSQSLELETARSLELETAESIARTCGYNVGSVRNVIARLGLSQNGVKTVLTAEQAELVKRRLLSNMHKGTPGNTDLHKAYEGDPLIRLASLYAEIDEIKSARIAALETENKKQQERLAVAEPKAETLDKITATKSDVSVRGLAAILAVPHLGQNKLFQRLRDDGYIDMHNRPYRQYIEAGLMYEKEYYVPQLDATKWQLRITQKGVARFVKLYGGKK